MKLIYKVIRKYQQGVMDRLNGGHPDDYKTYRIENVPYMADGKPEHLLDVYYPEEPKEALPVILVVHGGAYVSCMKEINSCQSQYFASKGFAVVNMSYTLYPEADIKVAVDEIYEARKWIEEIAEKYHFDTSKVYLTGDSAGGHLVLLAGSYKDKKYGFDAIAATCPIGEFSNDKGVTALVLKLVIGGMMKDRDFTLSVDYRNFMTKDYPPVFLVTTKEDALLYNHTNAMHNWLEANGIDHKYKEYAGTKNKLEHVFNVLYPWYEESIEANNDIIDFFVNAG